MERATCRVAVIGARTAVQGFALVGASVLEADEPDAVRAAWQALPEDVGMVVLTEAAGKALGAAAETQTWPMVVTMP